MFQDIYIIDESEELTKELQNNFKEQEHLKFMTISNEQIDFMLRRLPQLIIINDKDTEKTIEICTKIRRNEDNNIIPIMVISANEDKDFKMQLAKIYVEYYIPKSMGIEYLCYRIRNVFRLLITYKTISPLTGLPGNAQIQTELKKRLMRNEDFVVLYLDLDNFKAYNDVYGFLKGDEIIKFTARTIAKNVNNGKESDIFVGHIGGDDFVAILQNKKIYEQICQNIITEFDEGVKNYFTESDIKKGYIKVQNRRGKIEHFAITSMSIGVVEVTKNKFANILEIGEVGAQVKHIAKQYKESCYVIDRRKRK